jgi:MFS family permease
VPPLAAPRTRSAGAFPVVIAAIAVTMFASAAPSPLYPVYQQLWGFSAATLTIVFAAYVGALLVSLLTMGSLSDHVGRRSVTAASLLLLAVAMILFAATGSVAGLITARVVQGLATGTAIGTLSAAVVDLQPSRRVGSLVNTAAMTGGLGLGIAVSALLVQYAPEPRRLVFAAVAVALVVVVAAFLALVPETSPRKGFASPAHAARSLAPRVSVPREVRSAFAAAIPALTATWALGGLNLSLGSSILGRELGISNHAAGGALLSGFFLAAAAAAPLATTRRPVRLPASYLLLAVGLAFQLAGSVTTSAPAYVAGLVITGIGFSTAFSGVLASLAHAPASERSRLFAAVYIVSYVAFSVPAVIGGLTTDSYGLGRTTDGYTVFVLLMVALAAALHVSRRQPAPAAIPSQGEPPARREPAPESCGAGKAA